MMNTPNTTSSTPRTFPPKWNALSLRAKLVAILLMVALIPLAIVAFISDRNARQSAMDDANEKLLGSAASVAAQLDEFIQTELDAARYQAHLPGVMNYMNLPQDRRAGSPEEERLLDFMLTASYENPIYITSIAVLDVQGTTLMDTSAAEIGVSSADRVYFRKTLETGLPYASSVEYDHVTGKPSLYFVAPIQNANDELTGVLRIRYDALILQDLIARNTGQAGESSFAMLLDENHVRLAQGSERENIHKSVVPLDADLVAQLQSERLLPPGKPKDLATDLTEFEAGINNFAKQPTFTAAMQDGEADRVALAGVKNQSWLVAYAQPEAVILAPINLQTRTNIFTALLIAIGVAFLGLFLAEALADSIIRLTNTETVAAGSEVNIQTQVEAVEEIRAPALTFNAAAAQQDQVEAPVEAPAQPEVIPSTPLEPAVPIVLGEEAAGIFDAQPNHVGGFADSNTGTKTALVTEVSTSVAVKETQTRSGYPARTSPRKPRQTAFTEDKLEVAIHRLGAMLGRARVSANAQNTEREHRP
jgi:hypothetical protein